MSDRMQKEIDKIVAKEKLAESLSKRNPGKMYKSSSFGYTYKKAEKEIFWLDRKINLMTEWAQKILVHEKDFPSFNDSPIDGCPNINKVISFANSYLYEFSFDDDTSGYKLGFNWPYDYLSFVELIKMDAEVLFKSPDDTDTTNGSADTSGEMESE